MADKCKLVLVGDKWPAKEKLAENLIIPDVDKSQPLESQSSAICEKLGISADDLKSIEVFKGKGKPPQVLPGKELKLSKTPSEIGDKAGLVILYFRRAPLKVMLVGSTWPAAEKLSDNIMVKVRRNEPMSAKGTSIAVKLGLDNLEGITFHQCKGKGEKAAAGELIDFDKTPDDLNFTAAAVMLYVVQEEGDTGPIERTPEIEAARVAACLQTKTVTLTDGPLGLDFRASCDHIFVLKVAPGSPMSYATPGGVPALCCVHELDGIKVTTKEGVLEQVKKIKASGKQKFEVKVDQSEAAPFYLGARVECRLLYEDGSDEWQLGYIVVAYEGDFFDVQLLEEDEVERYVPLSDLRPILQTLTAEQEKPPEVVTKAAGAPAKLPPRGKEPDMEGDMSKKGEGNAPYKARRFVLYNAAGERGSALYYFAPKKIQPQGVLDLRDAVYEDRHATGEKSSKSKFSVAGPHISRIVLLDAHNEDDKLAWFAALEKAGLKATAASN